MPSMKPILHPLQTPKTMTFPSELQSGASSSLSDNVKGEDALSTPITPPAAYTEFLKALTPVFASPNSASVDFSKFTFDGGRTGSSTTNSGSSTNTNSNAGSSSNSSNKNNRPPAYSPASQPTSAVSSTFNFNPDTSIRSATASLPPPAPWAASASRGRRDPRNLRSLRIPPPPPYSPTITASPRSATTMRSPYSPSDWQLRYLDGPRSASGRLSVRHVVTHTVTYKRTELEDPPKGKRRKTQHKES